MSNDRVSDLIELIETAGRGGITREAFDSAVRRRLCDGKLDDEVILDVDKSLDEIAQKSPESELAIRALALEAARANGHPQPVADTAYSAGRAAMFAGHLDMALEYWLEAIEALSDIVDYPGMPMPFRNIAKLQEAQQCSSKEFAWRVASELTARLEVLPHKGWDQIIVNECAEAIVWSLAQAQQRGIEPQAGIIGRISELAKEAWHDLDYGVLGYLAGHSALANNNIELALKCWLASTSSFSQTKNSLGAQMVLRDIAKVFEQSIPESIQYAGQLLSALADHLESMKKNGWSDLALRDCAESVISCAVVAYDNDAKTEYEVLDQIRDIAKETSCDTSLMAGLLVAIADAAAHARGDPARSTWAMWEALSEARTLIADIDNPSAKAWINKELALTATLLHERLGGLEDERRIGLEAAETALEYYTPEFDIKQHCQLLELVSYLHSCLNNTDLAVRAARQAYRLAEGEEQLQTDAAMQLAHVSTTTDNKDEQMLQQARSELDALGPTMGRDRSWWTRYSYESARLRVEWRLGNTKAALTAAKKCLAAARDGNSLEDQADAWCHMAAIHLDTRDNRAALKAFEQAVSIADKIAIRALAGAGENPASRISSYLFKLSSYQERYYRGAAQLQQSQKRAGEALALIERSRGLLFRAALAGPGDVCVPSQRNAKERIKSIVARSPDTVFLVYSVGFGSPACYVLSDKTGCTYVELPSDNIYTEVVNLAGTEFESPTGVFDTYGRWLRTRSQVNFERWLRALQLTAQRIGDRLVAPLVPHIARANPRRIVLVPDGWMVPLPLQIAQVGPDAYLQDLYEVSLAPGLTVLDMLPNPPPQPCGWSLISSSGPDIPMCGYELDDIENMLTASSRFAGGTHAKVPRVEPRPGANGSLMLDCTWEPRDDTGLVHMTSHMQFAGGRDGSESSILMSYFHGGKWTHYPMNLEGVLAGVPLRFPRGITLILSGCESCAFNPIPVWGDARLLNLATTFLMVGPRTVVGSSWAIDDTAAYFLMQRFYHELCNGDVSVETALARAQRWLRTRPGAELFAQLRDDAPISKSTANLLRDNQMPVYSHPYYWAGWTCIGAQA